jgi:hypothetical protein
LVAAVFVIRSKVVSIQRQIEHKVDEAAAIAGKTGEVVGRVGAGVARATVGKLHRPARNRRRR